MARSAGQQPEVIPELAEYKNTFIRSPLFGKRDYQEELSLEDDLFAIPPTETTSYAKQIFTVFSNYKKTVTKFDMRITWHLNELSTLLEEKDTTYNERAYCRAVAEKLLGYVYFHQSPLDKLQRGKGDVIKAVARLQGAWINSYQISDEDKKQLADRAPQSTASTTKGALEKRDKKLGDLLAAAQGGVGAAATFAENAKALSEQQRRGPFSGLLSRKKKLPEQPAAPVIAQHSDKTQGGKKTDHEGASSPVQKTSKPSASHPSASDTSLSGTIKSVRFAESTAKSMEEARFAEDAKKSQDQAVLDYHNMASSVPTTSAPTQTTTPDQNKGNDLSIKIRRIVTDYRNKLDPDRKKEKKYSRLSGFFHGVFNRRRSSRESEVQFLSEVVSHTADDSTNREALLKAALYVVKQAIQEQDKFYHGSELLKSVTKLLNEYDKEKSAQTAVPALWDKLSPQNQGPGEATVANDVRGATPEEIRLRETTIWQSLRSCAEKIEKDVKTNKSPSP